MRCSLYVFFLLPFLTFAQAPRQPDAAEIRLRLNKLNFLGSVLYVAAHPDDENTRIITYMANGRLAATAYLSMTRGDGGQNLVGPEIRDQLGVIRTQELLAARRIDGGEQFFTRANDFGYSKSAAETFRIWGKDEILSDVVKIYRMFQPDVVLTRFPPDERAGHGHHTASAMLALEAFDAAARKDVFPDQVKAFGVWKSRRLYTNTGRWWNSSINENTPGIVTLDVGGYDPLLGESYSEIAARSRSQHKSQGFGSRGVRGYQPEYLEFEKGVNSVKDIFEGINTTWARLKGGEKIQPLVDRAISTFNSEKPAASVPLLLQIRKEIGKLGDGVWKERKLREVTALILDCTGLYCEATADDYWYAPGGTLETSIEMVNRSDVPIVVDAVRSGAIDLDTAVGQSLENNRPLQFQTRRKLVKSTYSAPYWLREPHSLGLFTVNDRKLIGKPENDPAAAVVFSLTIGGEPVEIVRPLVYRWTDPVNGEQYRPFEIVPPVLITVPNSVLIFSDENPREVTITLKSVHEAATSGNLKLVLPEGWRCEPSARAFTLAGKGVETSGTFKVTPPAGESAGTLRAVAELNGQAYDYGVQTIRYDHIPVQTLLPKAEAQVVRAEISHAGGMIGYIKGAGDDVPGALRNTGFNVWEMKDEEVTPGNLKTLDAVVLGIRALNTNERIAFMMDDLLDYVKGGGTLVVQYNTNRGLNTGKFAPYTLQISRGRVTDEDAEVRILAPDHPVLNVPNKIGPEDFDGWVQERGLYFPDKWGPEFTPILSMNDRGEAPLDGSLLVAGYGDGYYVYTGLSFFRELPEGVPGAYKLFANIVSLGNSKSASIKNKKNK